MMVDVSIDGLVAEHILTKSLVANLDGLAEGWVLKQALPHGGRGVVARPLEVPRLGVVGIGKTRVAIGEVVVPHGAREEFAA